MSPSISKDAILDAAEAIVGESGAAHMTLDGVAERANISKGGLMYSFPTKVALLQGMVGRLMDNIEGLREEVRREFAEANPTELMVEIELLSKLDEMDSRPLVALLAAIANQPDLMEPFRDEVSQRFSRRILSDKNPNRSKVLFLAAMGLHFSELLNIPFMNRKERKEVYEDLLRLASCDTERL